MDSITPELIARMRKGYSEDRQAKTLTAALAKTDMGDLAFLPMEAAKLNGEFSIDLKTHGITSQERSGRCWMYAGMNIVREEVIKNCNLDENFELSGNYLAFWDKLEKANNFLDEVIRTADEDLNSQRMISVLSDNVSDGGWWDEFIDLVNKYGVVPKAAMPEVYHSGHTAKFLTMVKKLMLHNAAELRKMIAAGKDPSDRKDEMMVEYYKTQCIAFGEPPKTFDFSYRDKNKEFHIDFAITPLEFKDKYVKTDLTEYLCITSEPTPKRPYHKPYSMHHSGNMVGHNIKCLNLPIEEAKELVLAQMKAGELVWFGCDSRQFGERDKGYWDPASFDYEGIMGGVSLAMTKEEELTYRCSEATHAMVLTGVNLGADGKPDRWRIENSWGKDAGKDGVFIASDLYFNKYVYEMIIKKKYLSAEQLAMYNEEPAWLEPWEV